MSVNGSRRSPPTPRHSRRLVRRLARIYEACSFQDITGQRVAKVVRTLQLVEARLEAILVVFAPEVVADSMGIGPDPLLNGPQSPLHAMDQNAVDALLAATQ